MLKLKIKDNICSTNRKGKDYKILPEKILDLFPEVVSELFLNDNINEITQKEFEIRYDKSTNRILIPVRNEKKELVGILSRINAKEFPNKVSKYNTFISYPPSLVLFGIDKNLKFIKNEGYAVLVEAEKSVMKAFSKNIRNVLATGGSHLFEEQCELLIRLGIQYRQGGTWLLYQKYSGFVYTKSTTFADEKTGFSKLSTKWTQKGRLFLYETLKGKGILPVIEQ